MPDTIRQGHGRSPYVCPDCGNKEYRAGRFLALAPEIALYKGQEERLSEICGKTIYNAGGQRLGECPGVMIWTPESATHDLLHEDFEVDLGDGSGVRRIRSLTELRAIENESIRRAANEPGHAPLVWRDFSQDRSNRDVNSLSNTSYERGRPLPPPKRITTQGRPITVRRGVTGD